MFTDAERAAIRVARRAGLTRSYGSDDEFEKLRRYFTVEPAVEIVSDIALYGSYKPFNDTLATNLEPAPLETLRRLKLPNRDGLS